MSDKTLQSLVLIVLIVVAGTVGLGYLYFTNTKNPPRENEPDCCKPDRKPEPIPRDGLQLHRWYRAKTDLSWCWKTRVWDHPVALRNQGRGLIEKGTPLYVVARHGTVAILRGAVRGEILVPDGWSAGNFKLLEQGEIGEEAPPPKKDEAEKNPATFAVGVFECAIPIRESGLPEMPPTTAKPQLPDLAGYWMRGTFITQQGRCLCINHEDHTGYGFIRDDQTILVLWQGQMPGIGLYRYCETQQVIYGHYAIICDQWYVQDGRLMGDVTEDDYHRSSDSIP